MTNKFTPSPSPSPSPGPWASLRPQPFWTDADWAQAMGMKVEKFHELIEHIRLAKRIVDQHGVEEEIFLCGVTFNRPPLNAPDVDVATVRNEALEEAAIVADVPGGRYLAERIRSLKSAQPASER